MLLLVYHLQRGDYAVDPEATDADGSALRTNVEEAYEAVADPVTSDHELMLRGRPDLREQVAVLVNVLNAAELGVRWELVHSLATSESDHDTIDGFLDNMEGILHFGVDERTRYHAPHPLWSMLYLEVLLDRKESEAQARAVFEASVNALFSFVDDEESREVFREWYGRDVESLFDIDENPTEVADEIVSSVFDVGTERPKLVPLYGTTEYTGLELPESCSAETRARCSLWRSRMYRVRGDGEQAVRELETYRERCSRQDVDSDRIDASYFRRRGNVALVEGDFESAREHYQQSLEIAREAGDRAREGRSLNNLGVLAQSQGNYEQAREYHERSLEIKREVGDRAGEARSFNNLGVVAHRQGDYSQAQKHHERSLDIKREVGDRAGEANSLDNLGLVARSQGEYAWARECHERSLEIYREVGDRAGEASSLGNLGLVARERGEYEQARECHERSLGIFREVGDHDGEAESLDNLGRAARHLGDYEQALAYHERSLDVFREIGDRHGEARSLEGIGLVHEEVGRYGKASDYVERASDIFRDIGALPDLLRSYRSLIRINGQRGDADKVTEIAERGLAVIEDSDVTGLEEEREAFENVLSADGSGDGAPE